MSDLDPIDDTLDQLELAVEGLTSSTSLDALRYIHQLGTTPGCSRHAAESVKFIADMYVEAEASLMAGIDHIEEDRDDVANDYLDYALVHLDKIAEAVALIRARPPEAPRPRITRSRN